jgi:hypothetical protein
VQLSNDQLEEMWGNSYREALTNLGWGPVSAADFVEQLEDERTSTAAKAADAWVKKHSTPDEWRSFQNERTRQKRGRKMVAQQAAGSKRSPRRWTKVEREGRDIALLAREIRSSFPRPT